LITHNDAPQSVGLLWTSDQLVAETSTLQHTTLTTNIHALDGIRNHDLSRGAAEDLRIFVLSECYDICWFSNTNYQQKILHKFKKDIKLISARGTFKILNFSCVII